MFELPSLPYQYSALEPYIDTQTMQIHHTKHHQAYIDNLNKALADFPNLQPRSLEDLLQSLNSLPESIHTAVRNHGGGHSNHSLFWQIMKPGGGGQPSPGLTKAITQAFDSFTNFQDQFTARATSHFGSGWAWLVKRDSKLEIVTTANQDSPLANHEIPLLGLDVWEHAYYLKYQNRRAEYISNWWHVVDWDQVAKNLQAALAS